MNHKLHLGRGRKRNKKRKKKRERNKTKKLRCLSRKELAARDAISGNAISWGRGTSASVPVPGRQITSSRICPHCAGTAAALPAFRWAEIVTVTLSLSHCHTVTGAGELRLRRQEQQDPGHAQPWGRLWAGRERPLPGVPVSPATSRGCQTAPGLNPCPRCSYPCA